jgi:hypothetical protein
MMWCKSTGVALERSIEGREDRRQDKPRLALPGVVGGGTGGNNWSVVDY